MNKKKNYVHLEKNTKHFLIFFILLLVACTQSEHIFEIDDLAFSQENMAHAAQYGTIYMTSTTQDGNHNCDDNPENCCVSGYHMCTASEILNGGRQLETTGTGRKSDPYNTPADYTLTAESSSIDCTGWTINTGRAGQRAQCTYTTTITCSTSGSVSCGTTTTSQWCCSR